MRDRPVAVALAGALTIAFSGILVRLADVAPETAAFFRCAYALPALGVLAWLERRRLGPRPPRRMVLALAGLAFSADLVFWHHAIADVGAGLATVLGNLQVVLVAFVAWATLGERPEARVVWAVPVVLMGVVLISGALEQGAYGDDPARGVLFGALTSLAYAAFILLLRDANVGRPAGPLFEATAWAAAGSLVAGLAVGTLDLVPELEAQVWLVLLALSSQVLGWMLISSSLPRLPAAVTSILLLAQPVASVVLAAVILGEDPSLLQIGGVSVVLAGIALATVKRRGDTTAAAAGEEPAATAV